MIRIRTVTYNMPRDFGSLELERVRNAFGRWTESGYEVRTQRISLPIYSVLHQDLIDGVAAFCASTGIRWFGISIDEDVTNYDEILIEDVLSKHKNAFVHMVCAKGGRVSARAVRTISSQFLRNAEKDSQGLIGFRFGASNNVAPNGPFFPFTYSDGNHFGFSIGLELAHEINHLCKNEYTDINDFRAAIIQTLEPQFAELERKAEEIAALTGLTFDGIDFSLAPLPVAGSSVMTILNKLGISNINDTGMLFATAFLTKILKGFAATHKSVGFSGVMYSLLEDSEYASMNSRGEYSINNMIALSTMCGCGVDMIPIPIDTPEDAIRTILLEVACVSSRLHKPLGVRILPVRDCGDKDTHFTEETDFVINTKIVTSRCNSIGSFEGAYEF